MHTDFGITFLGLNTDTQHLGYVLRTSRGENDVPEGLKKGLRTSNRLQEIVRATMRPGKTGNEVLQECLREMEAEKIEGQVVCIYITPFGSMPLTTLKQYCHPIGEPCLTAETRNILSMFQGDRGHAPGSLIGK